MAKCSGCKTEIPEINIEFGGNHYYTMDGDLYCSKKCHQQHMSTIGKLSGNNRMNIFQILEALDHHQETHTTR